MLKAVAKLQNLSNIKSHHTSKTNPLHSNKNSFRCEKAINHNLKLPHGAGILFYICPLRKVNLYLISFCL